MYLGDVGIKFKVEGNAHVAKNAEWRLHAGFLHLPIPDLRPAKAKPRISSEYHYQGDPYSDQVE